MAAEDSYIMGVSDPQVSEFLCFQYPCTLSQLSVQAFSHIVLSFPRLNMDTENHSALAEIRAFFPKLVFM